MNRDVGDREARMNPIAISFAVAGLALVAGVGVIAGFLREAPAPVEPLADPLDDRRDSGRLPVRNCFTS